jgi:hypothetical protein
VVKLPDGSDGNEFVMTEGERMTSGSWMTAARGRGIVLLSLLCVFALVFTVACGGDDDDDAADTTAVTTAETSTEASPTATDADTNATVAATATEPESVASPTATEAEVDATATEEDADATATEEDTDSSPTAGADDPLADVKPIDPEALPNFTMSFTFDLTGLPGQEDTSIGVEAEQSALDNYHMSLMTSGTSLETWLVDGTTYVDQGDGSIVELPEGTDSGMFSPAIFLQEVPPIEPELQAQKIGEEEVSGRNTVHYLITGENYLAQADMLSGGTATDVEGDVEVWIDTELNMMIKQLGDITWTNDDSTTGTFQSDMLIFDIGSTQAVEAPQ